MFYEINVAIRDGIDWTGKVHYAHLFVTAERSITSESELKLVYTILKEKFPEPEYRIDVTRYEKFGHTVDTKDIENI